MAGITGFFHGGITVKDMETSLAFYRDGLGLSMKFDRILDGPYLNVVLNLTQKRIRVAYLDIPGGGYIELLEYQEIERLDAASRPCDYGAGHFCFYVEGIDELAERMFSMGYKARSESCVDITAGPNAGARSLYLKDPDGYSIELFQKAPTQN
jgi:lactoylglutathione lyase